MKRKLVESNSSLTNTLTTKSKEIKDSFDAQTARMDALETALADEIKARRDELKSELDPMEKDIQTLHDDISSQTKTRQGIEQSIL